MASDQYYSPVITGTWFRDYGNSGNGERSFRPVITGKYSKPKKRIFIDRTPPSAGDGNYYKYAAGPDLETAPRMDFEDWSLIASLDAEERIAFPNSYSYNRFYTDGIEGYVAIWDASSRSSLGTAHLWRKKFVSISGSSPSFYYEYYDSGTIREITIDQWDAFVADHLHDLMMKGYDYYALQWNPSKPGSEVRLATYPGYDAFLMHRELGELPREYELVAAEAYLDQSRNLPVAETNSIANVLEYAGVVKSILTRDFSGISTLLNPKNAWLAYRYSYTTTKLDINEYVELTRRLANIAKMDVVTSHGYAASGSCVCKCTTHYDPRMLLPKTTRNFLEQYGLKLSLINVWDMIPYSFVVDWFFHIGTFLQDLEDRGNMLDMVPIDVWYSFSDFESNGHGYYFRVKDRPHYNAPFIGPSPASTRTTLMRVADAVSLFT